MKPLLIVTPIAAYLGLAGACLAGPTWMSPGSGWGMTMLGPPALFFWGLSMWPAFAAVSAALGGLVLLAAKNLDAAPLAIIFGALLWLASGFFAAALSI